MTDEENRTQVVRLLGDMMNAHSDVVRQSTEELTSLYTDPDSTVQVCMVLGNVGKLPAMRKCAGHILKNRLAQPDVWKNLLPNQQKEAQDVLLCAFKSMTMNDDENLQLTVVRNVGLVMGLLLDAENAEAAAWNDLIIDHVEELCVSNEKLSQLLGAICFKLLVKTSPNMFEKYLVRAKNIFVRTLELAKEQGELATPATEHLLSGWHMAIPLFRRRSNDHEELAATLPLIMQMTHAFAYQPNPKRSCRGFDVLEKLNKHLPELMWPHLKLVLDELFLLASDTNLSDEIRVQAIMALRNCVRSKRRHIIRLKMMDKLLMTLYRLMAIKPALDADGEELYLGDTEESQSPLSEAAQTVLYIAAESDTNRVAVRVLRLMQPQLEQQRSAVHRVAAQVFLALMAKGFTDLLADAPLRSFISAVETGIHDVEPMVRRSAHFALAIMAENLQPEITVMAPQVLPLFCEFFDQMTPEQRLADRETEAQSRMFCTLEIYCESLKREALQPHLVDLMKRLMDAMQPENNSISLRQLALSAVASLAKISKDLFRPHFDEVLAITLPLVRETPPEERMLLRTQAIQVVNMLSNVDSEKFAVHAPMLMDSYLEMMQHMTIAQVFTFEMLAMLSNYVPEQIKLNFGFLIIGILSAIKDGKDSDDDKDEDGLDTETDADADADASVCAEEDSIGDGHGDQTEEGNTRSITSTDSLTNTAAPDEALLCLKTLAVNMPDTVMPYISEATRCVSPYTDSQNELGKRAAFEVLTEFAILLYRKDDKDEAKRQLNELMPDLVDFVETAKETANVVGAMNCITKFLKLFGSEALEGEGFADLIINIVRKTLRRKLNCQFDIGQDTKMSILQQWSQAMHSEIEVMEAAGEMLPVFGQSMRRRQFAGHFHSISNRFLKSLRQCKPTGQITPHLYFLYNLVYRCMEPLGVIAEQYYDVLCYSVVDCMMDDKPHVLQFAINLINWMLTHAHDKENLDTIIMATSQVFIDALNANSPLANEKREQVAAILARMIMNCASLSTEEILTLIYGNLPFCHNFDAYVQVVPALRQLYQQKPAVLEPHLSQTLQVLLESLGKHQLPNEVTRQTAIELLGLIKVDQKSLYDDVSQQFPGASALIV
ncbi:importin-4-like [Drosophila montana]|uniref:importin-4-like n=1 Tax=Drosophila montana TaxID=40370 RepID=UPI00313F2E6A